MTLHISNTSEEWKEGYQDAFHGKPFAPPKVGRAKYKRGYLAGRRWYEWQLRFFQESLELFSQQQNQVQQELVDKYKQESQRLVSLLDSIRIPTP